MWKKEKILELVGRLQDFYCFLFKAYVINSRIMKRNFFPETARDAQTLCFRDFRGSYTKNVRYQLWYSAFL